jgi:hypothetical protein
MQFEFLLSDPKLSALQISVVPCAILQA